MKRKEFIAQVEKLGFEATFYPQVNNVDYLEVKCDYDCMHSITISEDLIFDVNTEDCHWITPELFALITEYAATPLEEREEQKEYVVTSMKESCRNGVRDMYKYGLKRYTLLPDGTHDFNFVFNKDYWIVFTSKEHAELFATLVDGEVEEIL